MRLNIFKKEEKDKKPKASKKDAPVLDIQPAETEKETAVSMHDGSGFSPLKRIYTSEKSTRLIQLNQYVFEIRKEATKNEVKKDVALRYNVKVKSVRIINIPGKRRMMGRYPGMHPGHRKAVVTLHPGSVIQQAKP
jgi:large subunit ribosomal protein L23